MLTTKEIIKKTDIKPSVLAYLTREGKLDCERRGRGISTLYADDAVEVIQQFLKKTERQTGDIQGGGDDNKNYK